MQRWLHKWLQIWWKFEREGGWLDAQVSSHYELTVGDRVLKDQEVFEYIDYLGLQGWELVAAFPEISDGFTRGYSLWFKRPFIADTTDQLIAGQGKAQAESGEEEPRYRRQVEWPVASEPAVMGQFETGDRVRHRMFGEGIVIESKVAEADEEVTVAFEEEKGVKRLLASFAKLEKLEG